MSLNTGEGSLMIGKTRRVGWLKAAAAMVGGLLTTTASAQPPPAAPSAPVRAVYVTAQDGNSKVYYVTGMVPQEKVPTPAPAALPPSSVKPLLPLPASLSLRPVPTLSPAPE